MRQKLYMFLAVLLTGGMLAACGPGDEFADDPAGGGVVDEPLGGDTFGDPAADAPAEGATVEMDVDTDAEVTEEAAADTETTEQAAADDTAEDVDMTVEETDAEAADTTAETGDDGDVAGGGAAAPAEGEAVVVTFSQAAEGVAVENIEGAEDPEAVAATGEENPDLNLTVGQRYEFVYDGEGDLVFMNSNDEPVLSTSGSDNAFADDTEANVEAEDGRISFTLTDSLAEELDHYVAGPDEQGGSISTN